MNFKSHGIFPQCLTPFPPRATFVHDRILDGHGVLLVQKQLRHVTPEMTRHYLTLDEQELETFFEKGIRCFT